MRRVPTRSAAKNEKQARQMPTPAEKPFLYHDRRFDVVAMGASASGLHALTEVLRALPKDFPSSIVIVQHLDPHHESHMTDLLSRITTLQVKRAAHGEILLPGVVYVAPPDEHLLVGPGKLHFVRPSVDLLFESVAGTYGSRSIGIVLSGSLRDGAKGIQTIKLAGGTTLVQEPSEADFRSMPQAAVATGCVDYVLRLAELGPMLARLCLGECGNG